MAIWSCGRLAARVLLQVLATNAGGERGIGYGDRLGMLVSGMMLFSMNLFVLLEVLGTLERLLAYFTDVRLERCVYLSGVSWTSEELNNKTRYL